MKRLLVLLALMGCAEPVPQSRYTSTQATDGRVIGGGTNAPYYSIVATDDTERGVTCYAMRFSNGAGPAYALSCVKVTPQSYQSQPTPPEKKP